MPLSATTRTINTVSVRNINTLIRYYHRVGYIYSSGTNKRCGAMLDAAMKEYYAAHSRSTNAANPHYRHSQETSTTHSSILSSILRECASGNRAAQRLLTRPANFAVRCRPHAAGARRHVEVFESTVNTVSYFTSSLCENSCCWRAERLLTP